MPNLDKSGPTGEGPIGLRHGGCVTPQTKSRGSRGLGQRLKFGRRTLTLEDEEKMLEKRLEALRTRKETE